jgi:hypothetical protein
MHKCATGSGASICTGENHSNIWAHVEMIHETFGQLKKYLPAPMSNWVRSFFTALLTPVLFSYNKGHFNSSWKMLSVSRTGEPLPWYTYPCIDFLKYRDFRDKTVLEFGGGQSSFWWAQRARSVVTLEGDKQWYEKIKSKMPLNVDLFLVSMESPSVCVERVRGVLNQYSNFDVIIVDGLYRQEMLGIASSVMTDQGAIICDDAENFGCYEAFKDSTMCRVDFFGNAAGVIRSHCTSVIFKERCFLISPRCPIPIIAMEKV